ncbi:MerR family transcriptional regulator [Falsihalocynthiibacter sp. SS001]|uniref:MerR family transcriptional regulator n=1 Tax=Falsihalocynthiibacter sp. SS001 TaxID=3349698 RepID=UPI0036D29B4F
MPKSQDAFRTISEVADWLETPAHVLRFWESRFTQVKPIKRAGGRRYYRPADMELLSGIKKLLHDDGMTIKGVQKLLRSEGIKHVASLSQPLDDTQETPAAQDTPAVEDANLVQEPAREAEPVTSQVIAFPPSQEAEAPTEPEVVAPSAELEDQVQAEAEPIDEGSSDLDTIAKVTAEVNEPPQQISFLDGFAQQTEEPEEELLSEDATSDTPAEEPATEPLNFGDEFQTTAPEVQSISDLVLPDPSEVDEVGQAPLETEALVEETVTVPDPTPSEIDLAAWEQGEPSEDDLRDLEALDGPSETVETTASEPVIVPDDPHDNDPQYRGTPLRHRLLAARYAMSDENKGRLAVVAGRLSTLRATQFKDAPIN